MSVARSLYEYLLDTTPISGAMGEAFASAQSVGNWSIRSRDEARQKLRSIVSGRIFYSRTPQQVYQTTSVHSAVIIRQFDSERAYVLGGEAQDPVSYITATAYARGGEARDRVELIARLLGLCVSGWYEASWAGHLVRECQVEDEVSSAIAPIDGSDDWVFLSSLDLLIYHRGPVAHYGR